MKMTDKYFVSAVQGMVSYWINADVESQRERLEGLAHSILAAIDGEGAAPMPPFSLRPIEKGREGDDIAGNLHNLFFKR